MGLWWETQKSETRQHYDISSHKIISGTIVAPRHPKNWGQSRKWTLFNNVHQLTVEGGGFVDGRGDKWWGISCNNRQHRNRPRCSEKQPDAITFLGTNDGHLRHLTLPMILDSTTFETNNIKVEAPEESPNTDGVHVQNVEHVNIISSSFTTGDDCVSIGTGSSHVYTRYCNCVKGHGISIGRVGENESTAHVKEGQSSDCWHHYLPTTDVLSTLSFNERTHLLLSKTCWIVHF